MFVFISSIGMFFQTHRNLTHVWILQSKDDLLPIDTGKVIRTEDVYGWSYREKTLLISSRSSFNTVINKFNDSVEICLVN